uniref:Pistil-specific extensin-like protein n=1 Tax=Mustela putorius furo TaxID=9669 RepID=M3YH52_MUSPF
MCVPAFSSKLVRSWPPAPRRPALRRFLPLHRCVPAFYSPLVRSRPPSPRRSAPLPPSAEVLPRLLLPARLSPASSSSPPPRRSLLLRMCVPAFYSRSSVPGLQLLAAPSRAAPSVCTGASPPSFSSQLLRSVPPALRRGRAVLSLGACTFPPSFPRSSVPGLQLLATPRRSLPLQRCVSAFSSQLVLSWPPAPRRPALRRFLPLHRLPAPREKPSLASGFTK